MIKNIKDGYFADKTYTLIYIHHFFHRVATSAMYIFTGAYFLKLGMPLHFVLLFYGLEFGVRGLMCPFGLTFLNKAGPIKALITSAFFLTAFFVGLSFADQNIMVGFFSLFLAAISGAIYYPLMDVLEAIYIKDDHNRTKQLAMGHVLRSMGAVISAVLVGFLIANFGFDAVVWLVSICLACSVISFSFLPKTSEKINDLKPKDAYKFLASKEFKPLWSPFFGEQLFIIVNSVMVPIFIYTVVEQVDTLGYLIAFTLIMEKLCTLAAGHYTDRLGVSKTMKFSMVSYPIAMGAYIFFVQTPISAFLVETYNKVTGNIYKTTFVSGMHAYARKNYEGKVMLFGTAWQMMLCFGELLILPLYGLLAYFIGIKVFYVACIMGVIGVWLSYRYFQKEQ